ncbi:Gfo/Idh/MocA family protein [Leeuwenhoekiella sp. NPDC079379]|uniref:Gfo/Idh/MocA family protein n=1 Tax=Leeuwenhoekiella sp. NPDC079379 TaxID=3364122 RepID=UPI0037CB331C
MAKIKIGIMGCAAIARRSVIPAIKEMSNKFELVCVASRNEGKANDFAKEFNCNAIVGYDKLLEEQLDAIYMPLPTGMHDEWVEKAQNKGLHIYAEKSIALDNAGAQKMVARAKSKELALMEGYMFQYHPQHAMVKDLLNNNEIGELRCFRGSFGFPPLAEGNFRYDSQIGGGVLHDAAGYPLRAAYYILGNDLEVVGSSLFFDVNTNSETFGSAFLKGINGIGAQIAFGFDNYYQCNYEIWGSKGKISLDRAYTPGANFSPKIILEKSGESIREINVTPCDHFKKAFEVFYDSIFNKEIREKNYTDILIQSTSLQKIKQLSV